MHVSKILMAAVIGGPFLAIAAPAAAQSAPEEIIVTGALGEVDEDVRSLSQSVSYADLDLTTDAGRDMLRHRVSLTARYLCDKLGEDNVSSPLVPSCRDAATRDAMQRIDTAESGFAPRGTTWVRPAAWVAPYPEVWYTQYPYQPMTYSTQQPVVQTVSQPVVQPTPSSSSSDYGSQTAPAGYTGERG